MDRADWDPDWDRIQQILETALRLSQSERSAFVSSACHHDPALVSEINSLLAKHECVGTIPGSEHQLVGTTIDERYLVERELGHGAIGRVYRAVALRLDNRPVVIKILTQASLQNQDVVQRFRQEAVALSRINHPGVVGVFDAGELPDGTPYIVMQYVDGETLRSQILSEGMDLESIAAILKGIGAALDHVHEKEILHRDLKPENIMIERSTGSVKIVDFGVAKVKNSALVPGTLTTAPIGTVAYMSPEQLRGEEVTAASDIYSMAVVAYEMVTGRRPGNPKSVPELIEMQRWDVRLKQIHPRRNLTRKAQAILLRALKFNPNERFKSAGEFGDRLACALLEAKVPNVFIERLVVMAVVALMVFGIYKCSTGPIDPLKHSFSYWLTVQRMRDGTDYQDPFKSFGEETFENGDKFRLNVSSSESGYLYVFNEGPPESHSTSFTLIYPDPATNNGSATLGANQSIQSDWITFRGPAGSENFWIVWSVSPVDQLESAKIEAFRQPKGGLTDQNLVTVQEFLRAKQSEVKVNTTRYKSSQQAFVRGASPLLIKFVEFRHR